MRRPPCCCGAYPHPHPYTRSCQIWEDDGDEEEFGDETEWDELKRDDDRQRAADIRAEMKYLWKERT